MNINRERKTTKYQKSFLFPQLISGDPRLQERTQAWQSISTANSSDGLVIPIGNFANERTGTEESFLANTNSIAVLLRRDDSESFRTRWNALEFRFADDPRAAVREADRLVAEISLKRSRENLLTKLLHWRLK